MLTALREHDESATVPKRLMPLSVAGKHKTSKDSCGHAGLLSEWTPPSGGLSTAVAEYHRNYWNVWNVEIVEIMKFVENVDHVEIVECVENVETVECMRIREIVEWGKHGNRGTWKQWKTCKSWQAETRMSTSVQKCLVPVQ